MAIQTNDFVLTELRVFNVFSRYRSTFRSGLVQGDKPVVYPIMDWLLKRIPDLKKRAYLAKYLVKVEVPPEIMAEDQIPDLYAQVILKYMFHNFPQFYDR